MYRSIPKHFIFKDPSIGKRICGNLLTNLISGHQSKLQPLDKINYRGYFSSTNKWQFFEEKPFHPSLLSDVSNESDITIEKGSPRSLSSAHNAFATLQKKMKDDLQKFSIDLTAAVQKDKIVDEDISSAVLELESNSVIHLEVGASLSCLKIIRSSLPSNESHNALIIKNLENTLVWRARNCSFKDLTMILSYCMKYQGSSVSLNERASNSPLLKEVTKSIERRWIEISDGRMFASVLHYPGIFSEQFILKVEGRIIELAESLPSSDLILVLKCLGFKKRRSVPLLRSIAYHLTRTNDELDLLTISSCLFAMKELSFRDLDFLDALSHSASRQLEIENDVQLYILRSIIQSIGQIRYRPTALLDQLAAKLSTMKDKLEEKDLVTFIMTNAALNYLPKNSEEIFRIIEQRLSYQSLSSDSKVKKEVEWLEIVWSLVVLEKAKPEHFKSVLSSEFYQKLLYSHDQRNVGVLLKLLNVNAAAQALGGSYESARINVLEDPLLRDIKLTSKADRSKLVSTILSSVESLATPPNFLGKSVNTFMGFEVDGEAIFDDKLKPVALTDHVCFSTTNHSKDKTLKEVPPNCHRVAFMVIGYHDTLFGSTELTGLASLYVKLLESQNYKVITVSHSELKPHHKNIERVKMIQQKLRRSFGIEDV